MRRKILIGLFLCLTMLGLFPKDVYCFEPDPNRWEYVGGIQSDVGVFFDKETIEIQRRSYLNNVKVWICYADPNSRMYKYHYIILDMAERMIGLQGVVIRSYDGEVIESDSVTYVTYDRIVPNSIGETLYLYIKKKYNL